jgi:hypothetical protein
MPLSKMLFIDSRGCSKRVPVGVESESSVSFSCTLYLGSVGVGTGPVVVIEGKSPYIPTAAVCETG